MQKSIELLMDEKYINELVNTIMETGTKYTKEAEELRNKKPPIIIDKKEAV